MSEPIYMSEMEDCIHLDKSTNVDDGYGGTTTGYVEGSKFKAAFVFNDTLEAEVAQKQGAKGLWTVFVHQKENIEYHEAFKRLSDNQIFRSVSKDDSTPPKVSTIKLRQFRAEEWEPPNG